MKHRSFSRWHRECRRDILSRSNFSVARWTVDPRPVPPALRERALDQYVHWIWYVGDDELAATPFGSLPMVPEANIAFVSSHLWPTSTDGMDLRESAAFDGAGPTIEPATLGLRLDFVDPSRPFHVAVADATGDTRPCFVSLVGAESDADPFDASLMRTRYSLLLADAAEGPNIHPASREQFVHSTPNDSVLTATFAQWSGAIEAATFAVNNCTLNEPLTALPNGEGYLVKFPRLSWCVLDVTATHRMPQLGSK